MALTNPISVLYNFKRNYKALPEIVVPIDVKNSNFFDEDTQVLSAYACPIDKLFIHPNFGYAHGLSASSIADDYRYFIDLGDGTISDDLTAQHFYPTPGDYTITLIACDSNTNFYKSVHQPVIRVFNAIEDTLYMTCLGTASAYQSTFDSPITITRFNSYQSYKSVSANGGYTVNLNVSGNKSDFKTGEDYNSDPYVHLKTFSVFASATSDGFTPITSVKTDNTFIYARRNRITPSQGLEFFTEPRAGTIFIGTSGTAEVYYYED
jgi:hypothetical protein